MDLKTFIAGALAGIVEGVMEAQSASTDKGALINPGGLTRPSSVDANARWDATNNNFVQDVSFDIAVTVEAGQSTSARIGVVAGLIGAGATGGSENRELAVSRLQFTVPVLLPAMQAAEGARLKPPGRTVASKGIDR